MTSFETPPQFNPENPPEQSSSPTVERDENPATPSKMKGVFEGAKEKISSYLKHQGLKVKEYFGQLNQKDLDQLLSFDFQEQLQDNQPIEGVFSPEDELAKITDPKVVKRKTMVAKIG